MGYSMPVEEGGQGIRGLAAALKGFPENFLMVPTHFTFPACFL
jgi:hypothetical protein